VWWFDTYFIPKERGQSVTRKAFEGYDEPVNIDLEPEEALRIVLQVDTTDEDNEDQE